MIRIGGVIRSAGALFFAVCIGFGGDSALAQGAPRGYLESYRVSDYLNAPGLYGMSYGFASYGMPQTYTVFSAMPNMARGDTLPPYGILPGKFGVGLWRPGFVAPGYVYGASYYYPPSGQSYRTFAVGQVGAGALGQTRALPPVGIYAPALGPATLYGW
jgi:hypothetical protein